MADVVVVGAGLGGLAVAARLAKRGHRVTVLERTDRAGGAIHRVEQDGFGWDAGPSSTTLPAVLRDLFRKSGRPLERYLELPAARARRDGTSSPTARPSTSRPGRAADQISAVDAGLGSGSGYRRGRTSSTRRARPGTCSGGRCSTCPTAGHRLGRPGPGAPARRPDVAGEAGEEGVQGRAAAADGGVRRAARRVRTQGRPGVRRGRAVPRAVVRGLGRARRRAGRASPTPS